MLIFIFKIFISVVYCLEVDDLILTKMCPTQDSNGMKLWQCNDCGYTRERKSDVRRHIEHKHVDLQVSCQYCDSVFTSRGGLKAHLKFKHGVQ